MKRLLAVLVVGVGGVAMAQPSSQVTTQNVISLRPAERDTFSCHWDRTITTGSASVRLIKPPAQADANPDAIIVAGPTGSGGTVSVTLKPDQGCASPGCRRGNRYQIDLTATDSDGNTPQCALKLEVKDVVY